MKFLPKYLLWQRLLLNWAMTNFPGTTAKELSNGLFEITGSPRDLMSFRAALGNLEGRTDFMTSASGSLLLAAETFAMVRDIVGARLSDATKVPAWLEERDSLFKSHESALKFLRSALNESLDLDVSPEWSSVLKPYQMQAVAAMKAKGLLGFCLFDEQGTGKTLTTVAAFDELVKTRDVDKLLVISPKTLLGTWEKEFKDFLPGKYNLVRIEGDKRSRYQTLNSSGQVFLISYESASTDVVELRALLQTGRFLIVFDESFFVKNKSARRSNSAKKIRELAVKSFVLCGTPAPNSPEDLVNQFDLADLGYTFLGYQGTGVPEIDSRNIADLLVERGAFVRRIKDDVLKELPEKQFEIVDCEMTAGQAHLYEEARTELELYLRRIDNSVFRRSLATYFQKRSALLQICVSPELVGDLDEVSGKDTRVVELVEEILSVPGRKVVVWSSYTRSIEHLCRILARYGVQRVDGTVLDSHLRQLAIWKFQNEPQSRVFIGNPAAAGAGITLTAASDAIYVSYPTQAAHFMQSLDRIHRIGQESKLVKFFLLVSKGTIEESVVRRLSEKQSLQSELLGDNVDPGLTLAQALEEIGASN